MLKLSWERALVGFIALGLPLTTLGACATTSGMGDYGPVALEQQVTPEIDNSVKGGTLTILDANKDLGFDPAKSQSLAITSAGLLHRRLTSWRIRPGQEAEVVPDLATDTGEVSADGKTWTYRLKRNLRLSDGSALTAKEIKYGLERSFAPALSGGLGYHKSLLVGGENYRGPYEGQHLDAIEVPDDYTIVFHLNQPYGDWPWIASTPAFAPVPEAKDNPEAYSRQPISSGPYQVSSYRTGIAVELERNPYWSDDSVRLGGPDKIVFSLGNDPVVAAQKIISDQKAYASSMTAAKVPAAQLITAAQSSNVGQRLQISTAGPLLYLAINTKRVTDVQVRRALNYAIDKSAVNKAAGGRLAGTIATTLITPGIPGREEYQLYPAPPEGDLGAARAELAKATDLPQTPLVLMCRNSTGEVLRAEAVARSLQQLGLQVRIDPVESAVFTERATQGEGDSYDLAISSWNPDFPSAGANLQPLFASWESGNGGSNLAHLEDPQIDQLILDASATLDPESAQKLWVKVDKAVMERAAVVPLSYQRLSYLHGSAVRNFYVGAFPAYPNYLLLGVK
ncbi:ABC transporter substrate-binding protein [Boudabousia marimammalium]|uniref:Solute-binding protein family 5 domain-containing protein n=1 Tax=Boudabousia marimammalium TaxID=156892 RepID=A0A1Q5PKJ1_9ACTO|nr:ABC transporter substrate-binding protein [Boudabousia marimammalium]OKL46732.1 hypothetical protein BM477_07220 [Boudabousia marimammalium]